MKYLPIKYELKFSERPYYRNPPSFVFRSVIGLSLRQITCALKRQKSCTDCICRDTCIYSIFFESNIGKETNALAGRDKGSHPFVIDLLDTTDESATLQITFIGKAINYIPYINVALEKAGKRGIGKNRTPFEIISITSVFGEFTPSLSELSKKYLVWPSNNNKRSPKRINLVTPCRIKEEGKYISQINLNSLLVAIMRRMTILEEMFGENSEIESLSLIDDYVSTPFNQRWVEKTYYSSRQKTTMKLGGVVGSILIESELQNEILNYVEAMELFHCGKNISFGLGKIEVDY